MVPIDKMTCHIFTEASWGGGGHMGLMEPETFSLGRERVSPTGAATAEENLPAVALDLRPHPARFTGNSKIFFKYNQCQSSPPHTPSPSQEAALGSVTLPLVLLENLFL